MNKSKKGFISMTLVYTFLVIFLFLMLAILNTYLQKDKFMEAIDDQIDEDIANSQGIRATAISKILEENTPYSMDKYYSFNISNMICDTGDTECTSSNIKDYSNGNGLFYSDDIKFTDENSDGSSNRIYFFRGKTESNHLVFANMCWRIIRTTEDGGIRIMYNGPFDGSKCKTLDQNISAVESGNPSPRSIGNVQFNSEDSEELYLGYVYSTTGETLTSDDQNPQSLVKRVLENWYRDNILDVTNGSTQTSYANSVAPSIYCNDRTYSSKDIIPSFIDNSDHNIYKTDNITNKTSLVCSGQKDSGSGLYLRDDRFNVVGDINGNGLMMYPIGLITAEEVAIAGGYLTSDSDLYKGGLYGMKNRGYHMYTKTNYWTMSPFEYAYDESEARYIAKGIYVDSAGTMRGASVKNSYDIIPVITLKSNIIIRRGSGSSDNPFMVR